MRNFGISKIVVLAGLVLLLIFAVTAYASGDVKNYAQAAVDTGIKTPGGQSKSTGADNAPGTGDIDGKHTVTVKNTGGEKTQAPEATTGGAIDVKAPDGQAENGDKRIIDPKKPMIALTFDDGPHPQYTMEILNTLKEYNARATFFVLGERAEKYRKTIKSISEEGNQIGNHTYDHKELTKLSVKDMQSEINRTKNILKDIDGIAPAVIRPPYGSVNSNVKLYAGAPFILWSVDTLDWKTRNKDKIVKEALKNPRDGDIMLMHDIYGTTAEAVKVIAKELDSRGYQLVTIDELYAARGAKLENGKEYFDCPAK